MPPSITAMPSSAAVTNREILRTTSIVYWYPVSCGGLPAPRACGGFFSNETTPNAISPDDRRGRARACSVVPLGGGAAEADDFAAAARGRCSCSIDDRQAHWERGLDRERDRHDGGRGAALSRGRRKARRARGNSGRSLGFC